MNELLEREEIEFILDLYRPNAASESAQHGAFKKPKAAKKQTIQARALAHSA